MPASGEYYCERIFSEEHTAALSKTLVVPKIEFEILSLLSSNILQGRL